MKTFASCSEPCKLDNNKLLLEAVKSGKDVLIQNLLNAGVSVSISDQFGGHPVYYAARYNHESILNMLLEKAPNLIDRPTKMLRTPLQISSYHGYISIVRILIEKKADVNLTDELGMSALHWAAENNHPKTVRTLLKASANRNLRNKYGKTALCLASERNNLKVCEILQDLDKLNDTPTNCRKGNKSNQSSQQQIEKNETIKLFEKHGIKLIPVDQSTIIANALKRGQTAVLTEAGKLALKKTQPEFLRTISNMTNTAANAFAKISPYKKMKVENASSNDTTDEKTVEKQNECETKVQKIKVLKADTKHPINMSVRKKLANIRPARSNLATFDRTELKERTSELKVPVHFSEQKNQSSDVAQFQLKSQAILIRDMKKQLEMSMRLTNYYKNNYEMKARETELYKTQLVSLTTALTDSGIEIVNDESYE